MEANNFLNKKQVSELNERYWSVSPNGKYITLYREDFGDTAWEEVCQQLDIPTTSEYADVLYFGVQSK